MPGTETFYKAVCTEAEALIEIQSAHTIFTDCTDCSPDNLQDSGSTPWQYQSLINLQIGRSTTSSEFTWARFKRIWSSDNDAFADVVYWPDDGANAPPEICVEPDPCEDLGGDTDGDGVCDDNDPCVGDNSNMIWRVIARCTDDQGNLIKQTVQIDCAGDGSVIQEKTLVYQDGVECGEVAIAPNDTPYDKDMADWTTEGEDGGTIDTTAKDDWTYRGEWAQKEGIPSTPAEGLETGSGSADVDPAEGETGLLEQIVDNTHSGNKNDQKIADYLKALNQMGSENGQTLQRILEGIEGGVGDGSGGDGADTYGNGQGFADGTTNLQDAYDSAINEFDTPLEIPEEYQTKTSFGDSVTGILNESPVMALVQGVELQASGSCSMSTEVYGQNIELSICGFESQLTLWGAIMESLVMLTSILIVFRRR